MGKSIQRIYRDHFDSYCAQHKVPLQVLKAGSAIKSCRTAELGGHVQACPDGHVWRVWYNSCKHRACPMCAFIQIKRWVDKQMAKLLDCDYYHTIFTVPDETTILWKYNRQLFTTLLFQAAWHSLKELLADPKYLGALPGAIASFHSWGQTLWTHPHAHFLVTGGGMRPDGKWLSLKGNILLPSRVLSAKFRGKFIAYLRKALNKDQLLLPPEMTRQKCINLFNRLGRKKWHVMIMPPYEHGRGVIRYLGRYVKGGPVSDRRILKYDGNTVILKYKNNRSTSPSKSERLNLSAQDFIARTAEHVPPPGIHTVRAYGLFAHSMRKLLNRARAVLGQLPVQSTQTLSWQQACSTAGDWHPERCPVCGKILIQLEIFKPGHSPPLIRRIAA